MITFLTFFLGLTVGVHPVELAVDRSVASVELVLDGVVVDRRDHAPWRLQCDFGLLLKPHHLEAIGYDDAGRELGRETQKVNLPRPSAVAALSLSDFHEGRYHRADLAWRSVNESGPIETHVHFDGGELELADERSVVLPPYDPQRIHFLTAELVFGDDVRALAELAFGGQYGESVTTELTAVAVSRLEGKVPTVEETEGWFLVAGQSVQVVAVEEGRSVVIAVRDRSTFPTLQRVLEKALQRARAGRGGVRTAAQYFDTGLSPQDALQFLLTSPETVLTADGSTQIFPLTPNQNARPLPVGSDVRRDAGRVGGAGWALVQIERWEALLEDDQWLSSAVAMAGLTAAASNRPRAVVLILGEQERNKSLYAPAGVRAFLRVLQVPLIVMRTSEESSDVMEWGSSILVSEIGDLNRGVRSLRDILQPQYIVWLDGVFLPQEISLSAKAAKRARLAGH